MTLQTTRLRVTLEVVVPGNADPDDWQGLIDRVIGSGQEECRRLQDDPDCAEDARRGLSITFGTCVAEKRFVSGPDCACDVDVDEARYVGDGDDGVYYQVFEDSAGSFWWSALIGCNSGAFCEALAVGEGPYDREDCAWLDACNAGSEWCAINEVPTGA
jgi:hypothetical protein